MASTSANEGRRKGITIYPADETVPFLETDFLTPSEGPAPQEADPAAAAELFELAAKVGHSDDVIMRQSPEEGGFSLIRIWFKPNYPLVRHTHNSDCLYYVLYGELTMGNRKLRTGDSFFVPANAPYRYTAGPDGAEVLEIRHGVEHFDINVLDPPEHWQFLKEVAEENAERWANMDESPTLAANHHG